jgi:hypothetical protein
VAAAALLVHQILVLTLRGVVAFVAFLLGHSFADDAAVLAGVFGVILFLRRSARLP